MEANAKQFRVAKIPYASRTQVHRTGIQYKKVNPAFTSIIGKYKYRWMHKISIHESVAYVIGRRGLGYNEKLSFYKADAKKVNIEAILTGLQVSLADLKEFVGNIWYRGETLRG